MSQAESTECTDRKVVAETSAGVQQGHGPQSNTWKQQPPPEDPTLLEDTAVTPGFTFQGDSG